jgi:hypothetical protein
MQLRYARQQQNDKSHSPTHPLLCAQAASDLVGLPALLLSTVDAQRLLQTAAAAANAHADGQQAQSVETAQGCAAPPTDSSSSSSSSGKHGWQQNQADGQQAQSVGDSTVDAQRVL